MIGDAAEGPAFDTNVIGRPSTRKLVGCWMAQAGLPTMILPEVWRELTRNPLAGATRAAIVDSWLRIQAMGDAPFAWVELDAEQRQVASEVVRSFTQPCFPGTEPDALDTHGDAIVVAEAVAVGAAALVTADIRSIDHYEINAVLGRQFGRNIEFVTTLDSALCRAHQSGQAAEGLLTLALATIAPPADVRWGIDAAHEDLQRLREALMGSRLHDTGNKLENRWENCCDLEALLAEAQALAQGSHALQVERQRAVWHREARGEADQAADSASAASALRSATVAKVSRSQ